MVGAAGLRQTSSYAIPPKRAAARWTRFLDRVHYRAPNGSPRRKQPITLGVLSPRPDAANHFPKETRRIIAPSDQATPTQ